MSDGDGRGTKKKCGKEGRTPMRGETLATERPRARIGIKSHTTRDKAGGRGGREKKKHITGGKGKNWSGEKKKTQRGEVKQKKDDTRRTGAVVPTWGNISKLLHQEDDAREKRPVRVRGDEGTRTQRGKFQGLHATNRIRKGPHGTSLARIGKKP